MQNYTVSAVQNDSSINLGTKTNMWKVESLESTIVFLRNKMKYLGRGAVYLEEVKKKARVIFLPISQPAIESKMKRALDKRV